MKPRDRTRAQATEASRRLGKPSRKTRRKKAEKALWSTTQERREAATKRAKVRMRGAERTMDVMRTVSWKGRKWEERLPSM